MVTIWGPACVVIVVSLILMGLLDASAEGGVVLLVIASLAIPISFALLLSTLEIVTESKSRIPALSILGALFGANLFLSDRLFLSGIETHLEMALEIKTLVGVLPYFMMIGSKLIFSFGIASAVLILIVMALEVPLRWSQSQGINFGEGEQFSLVPFRIPLILALLGASLNLIVDLIFRS